MSNGVNELSDEQKRKELMDKLLYERLTKGSKIKIPEDKTQLESKIIVPKSQVSTKMVYRKAVDDEGQAFYELVPFHTLFKEQLTEDVSTSNLVDEFDRIIIREQFELSQFIQKICLMSGFPFKEKVVKLKDGSEDVELFPSGLNLVEAADFFTDMANLETTLHKSYDGFAARIIKSEFASTEAREELVSGELKSKKKGWWKFKR